MESAVYQSSKDVEVQIKATSLNWYDTIDHYSLTEDIFRIGSAVCQLSKDVEVPIKATSLHWYDKIDYFETVFGGMTIGRYINGLISMFQSQSKYDELSDFFKKHPIKQAERSISQGLEKIKTTSALVERDGDAIKQFFKWLLENSYLL